MNAVFMRMQILQNQLRQSKDPNHTMKSDIGQFKKKVCQGEFKY
ncbi:unnamed protein product [Larinioides sclopetarius]|uniref:Uncharacterized protein n=1 Tax=Larinioides sclopetarius TaxID=280406 RepID=A0AAV2AP86_9ARAC